MVSCREVYVAQLIGKRRAHTESIELRGKGIGQYAILKRYGRPIAEFKPSKSQIPKIKKNKGNVRITSCQISRASLYKVYRERR